MNKMSLEKIDYDDSKNEFYISVRNVGNQEISRKELSSWGLCKEASGTVIIKRLLPSLGTLETETVNELYSVELKYTVDAKSKTLYLIANKEKQDNGSIVKRIFMKDVDSGRCQSVPFPSSLYVEEIPELSITKSIGKLISKKEAVAIMKSGEFLGIFQNDMSKKCV
jgi:hypothetical protein